MTGLVENYAAQLGWKLSFANFLVEGTSDVAYLARASELHQQSCGRAIIDSEFNVIAAGLGDDGGVDGVNRALNAMRLVSEADRDEFGGLRFRFAGLYDNDFAGRQAVINATNFDRRIVRYHDVFLLHPVMPAIGDGTSDRQLEVTAANIGYSGMDWEIEDLCSTRLLDIFEANYPAAIQSRKTVKDRTHREIAREAKGKLIDLFVSSATFEDATELIRLLKLMRGYLGVAHNFIQI